MESKGNNICPCESGIINWIPFISIDAEWITDHKDYQEAKKRNKAKHKESSNTEIPTSESDTQASSGLPASSSNEGNIYKEEMDEMRCILYAHGGMLCLCLNQKHTMTVLRGLLFWER